MPQHVDPSIPDVTLAEKVAFLCTPSAWPDAPPHVDARETRYSWVFLTDDFAYKLKKPAVTPHFDFRAVAQRRANGEAELRVNARLAPGIYLGLVPLVLTKDGRLQVGGEGEPVDWLVRMRRLPDALLMDTAIRDGRLRPAEVLAVADHLAAFYTSAVPVPLAPDDYLGRFRDEQAENRRVLALPVFGLAAADVQAALAPVDALLRAEDGPLLARLTAGRIVEGHGDLRPEHICLGNPPAAIDALEFSRRLRLLDPFEELAFLGLECAVLGADWVGPLLIARCATRLADPITDRLVAFYAAFRAALRARQAISHLLDDPPREPAKWRPLTQRYLAAGAAAAARLHVAS